MRLWILWEAIATSECLDAINIAVDANCHVAMVRLKDGAIATAGEGGQS